jgi:ring-1,2-phenylacetyl-CoA epoxidase subunit PaaC
MAQVKNEDVAVVDNAHIEYLLHLADNALVLGQRNAEWCGNGPVLEEDIALANISVDLIGQARMLYQHVALLKADGATEDTLAYFRDAPEFRNFTLLELPHSVDGGERDYAVTMVRNFLYSALMVLLWDSLQNASDPQLAAIAERSVKETRYHLRHSRDWLIRLGDGTAESHRRTQAALEHLMPYTLEFWEEHAIENAANPNAASVQSVGLSTASLRSEWQALVDSALQEATLAPAPPASPFVSASTPVVPQGKFGIHSEHLAVLLRDMQSLARQHPQATW